MSNRCEVVSPESAAVYRRIWNIVAVFLGLSVLVKLLYIFMMTRRNVGLGYPYNSYVFDPFHRFTDWLISLAWSLEPNPWSTTCDLAKNIPPSPYGPVTFWYLKYTSCFGDVLPFFAVVLMFLFLGYMQMLYVYKKMNIENSDLFAVYVLLVIGYYPIHFIVDRGNADIFGGLLVAMICYGVIMLHGRTKVYFVEACLVLLMTSKPTWAVLSLSALFLSRMSIIRVFVIGVAIYAVPLLNGISYYDYIESVKKAMDIIGRSIVFSNDLYAGIQVLSLQVMNYDLPYKYAFKIVAFGGVYMFLGVAYFYREKNRYDDALYVLVLLYLYLCILMFNRPSPDYRLVAMLPLWISMTYYWVLAGMRKEIIYTMSIFFSLIVCWMNFYMQGTGYSVMIPVRAFSIFLLSLFVLYSAKFLREYKA